MKPIEYCLDTVLRKLEESYNLDNRPELIADDLLKQFDLQNRRHEFFIGLIKKLKEDGFVDYLIPIPPEPVALDFYRKQSIITPKGLYFLHGNGYLGQIKRERSLELTVQKNETRLRRYTLFAGVGAIGLLIWEVYKYWNEHPHWLCSH